MIRIRIYLAAALSLLSCGTNVSAPLSPSRELKKLEDLPFRAFLDESYKSILRGSPELVTEWGLDEELGMPGNTLDSYAEEDIREIEILEQGIYGILMHYDPDALAPGDRMSYLAYRAYLEDLIEGQKYRHFTYPVSHMLNGVNVSTEQFFTELHPLRNRADARNYIERLGRVDEKMAQVVRQIEIQQEKGIVMPKPLLYPAIQAVRKIYYAPVEDLSFYKRFAEAVGQLDLDDGEREQMLREAKKACADSVIPGYRRLAKKLLDQQSSAGEETGVCTFPGGADYYAHALAHHTNSRYTGAELNALGLEELEKIHGEMRRAFKALRFDPALDIGQLYRRLDSRSVMVPSEKMVATHSEIAERAKAWMEDLFYDFPGSALQIKGDREGGGFYVPPPLAGDRPGIFYASERPAGYYTLPTLTFHETFPGHHYQISLNGEMDLPLFQRQAHFTGFLEGWALYAEGLMARTGYYRDDTAGYLGYLQASAFRAARLVVDTGLHRENWSIEEAVDFFCANTGYPRDFARAQIYRYLAWPGQAASYYAGYLEFRSLEERERLRLADRFSYKDFHRKLLENGPVPLTLLSGGFAGD